jgi:hypothetical protein
VGKIVYAVNPNEKMQFQAVSKEAAEKVGVEYLIEIRVRTSDPRDKMNAFYYLQILCRTRSSQSLLHKWYVSVGKRRGGC